MSGPIFGELLAKQFAEMWRVIEMGSGGVFRNGVENPSRPLFDLVEAGAGNGRLARDILDAARRNDPEFYAAIRLSLVEQSPSRACRADRHARTPRVPSETQRARRCPTTVHGVIFANELLDALPTHVGGDDRQRAARSIRRFRPMNDVRRALRGAVDAAHRRISRARRCGNALRLAR